MLGHLYDLTRDDALEHLARSLPELSNAHSVTHGGHNVAHLGA